jgi:formate hydrogenlyase subunit 6/NADH:ubiquinone oxidoreductase subunit I
MFLLSDVLCCVACAACLLICTACRLEYVKVPSGDWLGEAMMNG